VVHDPGEVIATTPMSRNVRNTVEVLTGLIANRSVVAPTIRFDWTVKNANVLNPRSAPVRKCPRPVTAV
jgi:hypothetical protein